MDDEQYSIDDLLEEARGHLTYEVGKQGLEEDNDTPASPAWDSINVPDYHQLLDSDIDAHELYDEGFSGVSGYQIR